MSGDGQDEDDLDPHLKRLLGEQQAFVEEAKRETSLYERDLSESNGERESLVGIEDEITGMHGTMKDLAEHLKYRGKLESAQEIHVHVPPTPEEKKRHAISMNPPVLGKVRASGLGLLTLVVIVLFVLYALGTGLIKT